MGFSGKYIFWKMMAVTALFMLSFAGSWADFLRSRPEQAQNAYRKGDFQKALELYQDAATRNPDSDTLAYNLSNAQYSLGQFKEAAGQYAKIAEKDKPELSGRSLYNLGNSLFQMGKAGGDQKMLEQALEAYRTSIRKDPEDEDSKYNYELTRRLIQKQQQQQQQQNQDNKDQQKKDQEKKDQQQQQNQDQQKKQEEKKQQEQPQAEQQDKQQQQQQPQPQPGQMSKEEAERILNALMQMEKDMQEKEKKAAVQKRVKGPDW
jgi:Ca-activated chloride channel homolog